MPLALPFRTILNTLSLGCINEKIASGRSFSSGNIIIGDCSFSRSQTLNDSGGVIYLVLPSTLNVSYSMFYLCSANPYGGAFHVQTSYTFLFMICASRCKASSYHHFGLFGSSGINYFEFLSISQCSDNTNGMDSISLNEGEQMTKNINSSFNQASHYAGFF